MFKNIFRKKRHVPATDKQLSYLNYLVASNNKYRAKPQTLSDWVNRIYSGQFDMFRAKHLIQIIKDETEKLRTTYRIQRTEKKQVGKRSTLLVSDINHYFYCPKAFEFNIKNKANRNVYELNVGRMYHGEESSDQWFSGPKRNENEIYLRSLIEFKYVEWIKSTDGKQVYSKEMNMAGIPDGVVTFKDGTQSIIEIKSSNKILREPNHGDVIQTVVYNKMFNGKYKLNDKALLLYVYKGTGKRYHFELDVNKYEQDMRKAVATMNNIMSGKYQAFKTKNTNKCNYCGFSRYCR